MTYKYKPWCTPEQNRYMGLKEKESKRIEESYKKKRLLEEERVRQASVVINKDFNNYKMNDCLKYVDYFEKKIEKAYKSFEVKKYDDYKLIYREIKTELKADLSALKKVKNNNSIIETYLLPAVQEAYLHMTERVNSVSYEAIYSCFGDVSTYLKFYFETEKSIEI